MARSEHLCNLIADQQNELRHLRPRVTELQADCTRHETEARAARAAAARFTTEDDLDLPKRWFYSFWPDDDVPWHGPFETRWEAIAKASEDSRRNDLGCHVTLDTGTEVHPGTLFYASELIDLGSQRLNDEHPCDGADDLDVAPDAALELQALIDAWASRHVRTGRYVLDDEPVEVDLMVATEAEGP